MWRHWVETSLIPRLTPLTLMILMTWHSGCSTRTDSAWLHATAPLRVHRWMCANHGGETSERTPWVTGNRDLDWWERDYRRDALVVITCHSYISETYWTYCWPLLWCPRGQARYQYSFPRRLAGVFTIWSPVSKYSQSFIQFTTVKLQPQRKNARVLKSHEQEKIADIWCLSYLWYPS